MIITQTQKLNIVYIISIVIALFFNKDQQVNKLLNYLFVICLLILILTILL